MPNEIQAQGDVDNLEGNSAVKIALQADVCAALPRLHEELLEADADEARMIERAAASSPLLEATHACHELLEMRLFQT